MARFTKRDQKAYQRSNSIESLGLHTTPAMVRCVLNLRKALESERREKVLDLGQELLDHFCDELKAPAATLKLNNKARARFTKGRSGRKRAVWKLYGTCDDEGVITVAFRTAVQKKVFAFKTFLNTLVHEFCHHIDFQKLKLHKSFHCRGFYMRVDSLYKPLVAELGTLGRWN